jgi:hypothetical protein
MPGGRGVCFALDVIDSILNEWLRTEEQATLRREVLPGLTSSTCQFAVLSLDIRPLGLDLCPVFFRQFLRLESCFESKDETEQFQAALAVRV